MCALDIQREPWTHLARVHRRILPDFKAGACTNQLDRASVTALAARDRGGNEEVFAVVVGHDQVVASQAGAASLGPGAHVLPERRFVGSQANHGERSCPQGPPQGSLGLPR